MWRKSWSWLRRNPWIITASASALILSLIGLAYFLGQQNAFLNWKLSHPYQITRHDLGLPELPYPVFLFLLYYSFLIGFPYLDLISRRRRSQPILRRHLAAYTVIGSFEAALGIFLVLKWAEALAWHMGNYQPWLVFAFALSTFGGWVIWEAGREHLSAISGFTGQGRHRPDQGIQVRWKKAPIAALNEMFALTGSPEAELKIGPVAATSAMVVASFLWLTVGASWVVAQGWLWAGPLVNGVLLSVAIALWVATKRVSRFVWGGWSLMVAGVSIWPVWMSWTAEGWERPRMVSFEGWIIGTAIGLLLVKILGIRPRTDSQAPPSPEAVEPGPPVSGPAHALKRGSFEALRFLAAWASLEMFFAWLGPGAEHSPDWFIVLAGAGCLPATAWCLSLCGARRSSVILLVLLLIFGSWVIFASPYAIPLTIPMNR